MAIVKASREYSSWSQCQLYRPVEKIRYTLNMKKLNIMFADGSGITSMLQVIEVSLIKTSPDPTLSGIFTGYGCCCCLIKTYPSPDDILLKKKLNMLALSHGHRTLKMPFSDLYLFRLSFVIFPPTSHIAASLSLTHTQTHS
ncbi:hypothetical protein R6Q59_021037 [Mikania micrantha]